MHRVFEGDRQPLRRVDGAHRAVPSSRLRRRPQEGTELGRVHRVATRLQRARRRRHLPDPAAPACAPAEPAGLRTGGTDARVQHGGELHHEHELAGVLGRDDDELPHADGGTRVAQLRLRRRGNRRRDRGGARADAQDRGRKDHRKLLGRSRSRTLYVLLPLCVVFSSRAGVAGRDPELLAPTRRSRPSKARSR